MIDSQCNVHTAICDQYRVGATAAQAGSDKETPISKNTKFDIEAQKLRYRIQISKEHLSISINLRDLDTTILKSELQYRCFFDIMNHDRTASISKLQASISKVLRYSTGSISIVTTFGIEGSQN